MFLHILIKSSKYKSFINSSFKPWSINILLFILFFLNISIGLYKFHCLFLLPKYLVNALPEKALLEGSQIGAKAEMDLKIFLF